MKAESPTLRVYKNMSGGVEKSVIVDWTSLLAIFEEKRFLMRALGRTWKQVWTSNGIAELKKIFRIARTPKPEELIGGWTDYEEGFALGADGHIESMITEITKTTSDKIMKIVRDGLNDGLPIAEISGNIQGDTTFDAARATLIARTEATRVHGASNLASMTDAKSFGVRVRKSWLANRDDHTREEHLDLLAKYGSKANAIEPEEDFIIGDHRAPNPGAFQSPDMDCNCRCTILPVVIRD